MNLDLTQPAMAATAAVGGLGLAGLLVWALRRPKAGAKRAKNAAPAAAADTDPVTRLMTRGRFELILQDRLRLAEKQGQDCCVLHVGLDHFRFLQDVAGAELADKALAAVAVRLRGLVGASTPLARVGTEEFVICLGAAREAGEKLAQRITHAMAEPLLLGGHELDVSASAGLAVSPEHGSNPRLIDKAAAATRAVQRIGGGAHAIFDPRIEAAHSNELSMARDLRDAVSKGQLELFFQPKIDARRLEVSAVEALLRWRHPAIGLVSPADFIPLAERQGLMEPLGQWVLEGALKQAAAWQKAGLSYGVAVNIAGGQFRRDDFAMRLARSLKTHGVPPTSLICEIPEAVALEDTDATRQAFARLNKLGVRIAIGGFSGHAAGLAALAGLPVQEVKVHRSVVTALAGQSTAQADAQGDVLRIVKTAHALKLRVVAEGVENEAQRDQAVRLGCDELQGHLFAKPMSARAVAIWAIHASRNLTQTLKPSQFKDTQVFDV